MDILFLSHCAPAPPDKGERIRAYHEVVFLASRCRLHLACFARTPEEMEASRQMAPQFGSFYMEPLHPSRALARAASGFARGGSLTLSFYASRAMRAHVQSLARRVRLDAVIAYSSAMAAYAPGEVPLLLDMVDVDSEKWLQYARQRWPGSLYAAEGRRLRLQEREFSRRSRRTFLCTGQELALFQECVPDAPLLCLENGVDGAFFDPVHSEPLPGAAGSRWLVFTGVMGYYPNQDAACWFAREVFPELRRHQPSLQFVVVGRSPSRAVRALADLPGVTVTGPVPDIRPYLRSAAAVITPLRIARGIQNKALEALAMGKRVLASPAVCDTFGPAPPTGLHRCESMEQYAAALAACPAVPFEPEIRRHALERFDWGLNLDLLWRQLQEIQAG